MKTTNKIFDNEYFYVIRKIECSICICKLIYKKTFLLPVPFVVLAEQNNTPKIFLYLLFFNLTNKINKCCLTFTTCIEIRYLFTF
jgi:hypothetical protein